MAYLSKYDKKSTSVISKIGKNLVAALSKANKLLIQSIVVSVYTIKNFFGIGSGIHISVNENNNFYSAGYNGEGQLGGGYNDNNYNYDKLSTNSKSIVDIQAGTDYTSYLTSDGFVWSWGYNGQGQLGIGNAVNQSSPVVVVPSIIPMYDATRNRCYNKIAVGTDFTIGLTPEGQAWTWGMGTSGQLGTYTLVSTQSPVRVCMTSNTFCQVAAGNAFALAINNTGQLFGWGDNSLGQLGLGFLTSLSSPMAVCQMDRTFLQIAKSGSSQTYALDQNGQVWAWGDNSVGYLGVNNLYTRCYNSPVAICMGGRTFCQIFAGTNYAIALTSTGQAFGWGLNTGGQLGDSTIVNKCSPVAVCMGGRTFCQIATGSTFVLAIDQNGIGWSWGMGANGALGNSLLTATVSSPVAITMNARTFCQVFAGNTFGIALSNLGGLFSWGTGAAGELGDNTVTAKSSPVAVCIAGRTFCKIGTGNVANSAYAITNLGQTFAWGTATTGGLGDNTTTGKSSPVAVCVAGRTFCQITGGTTFGVAINNTGQLFGWGLSTSGQIGNNTTTSTNSPVAVCMPANKTICQIYAGSNSMSALDSTGQMWTWGSNILGESGNLFFTTFMNSPIRICDNNITFCQISAGYNHSLALDKDNNVYSWGSNTSGQIGNNTIGAIFSPLNIAFANKTICQIFAGNKYSLVLDKDGQSWGWGVNASAQLNDNTIIAKSTPVAVCMNGKTFCQIAVGRCGVSTIVLSNDNKLYGWGDNTYGQIGVGLVNSEYTKQMRQICVPSGKIVKEITVGWKHTVALMTDNTVYTWGNNALWQLGTSDNQLLFSPIKVYQSPRGSAVQVIATVGGSAMIDQYGKYYGWGQTQILGNNLAINKTSPIRACQYNILSFKYIAANGCGAAATNVTMMALDQNGQAWGWGGAGLGELGDFTLSAKSSPVAVCQYVPYNKITVGGIPSSTGQFVIALDTIGRLWSWGGASLGVLGDNTTTAKSSPVAVCIAGRTFCQISSGNTYSLALDKNGQAFGWGIGSYGQLGNSTILTNYSSPIAVCMGGRTFCQISAGVDHSLAVDGAGIVYAWGLGTSGQLANNGNPANLCRISPLAIGAGFQMPAIFCKVSAGDSYSLALDQNGQVWAWGSPTYGRLGNNTISGNICSPVAVCQGGRTFCQIFAGSTHAIAVDNFGDVYTWGGNTIGQLGNNTLISTCSPIAVLTNTNMRSFCQIGLNAAGQFGLTSDGQVYGWGIPTAGNLGQNDEPYVEYPIPVCMGNRTFCNITKYTSLRYHFALDVNGQAFAWGQSPSGQLGDNTAVGKSSPVAVCMGGRTFCQIVGQTATTFALAKTGEIFAWGLGTAGQLGNNQTITNLCAISPVAVCTMGRTFCQIATIATNTIALDKDGNIFSWGLASQLLGDNTATGKSSPVPVCTMGRTFCQIASGQSAFLALDNFGQAFSWGSSTSGQIGDNSIVAKCSPVAVCMGGRTFCKIYNSLGTNFIAKDNLGNFWGWGGFAHSTNFGTPTLTNINYNIISPIQLCTYGKTICDIIVGVHHTLMLDNNNQAWQWGIDDVNSNILGAGDFRMCRTTPTYANFVNQVRTTCYIETGAMHNTLIDSIGQVWTWGKSFLPNGAESGQLGLNKSGDEFMPRLVCTCGIKAKSNVFASGVSHSIFNSDFDRPFAWGLNTNGGLGDNSTTARSQPVAVCLNQSSGLKIVEAGNLFTVGLGSNNLIYSWGINTSGQLGDNSVTARSSPVAVCQMGRTFCTISVGYDHTLALDNLGKTFAWGNGLLGKIGHNAVTTASSPVAVCQMGRTFCSIYVSDTSSIALDNLGQAFAWGNNQFGQLGDNTIVSKSSPVAVCMPMKYPIILSGNLLFNNGQAWVRGFNNNGQLGDNTTTDKSSPVAVCMGGRTFCKIIVGYGANNLKFLALDNLGQAFAWGLGTSGGLGNFQTATNYSSPIAVCMGGRTFCQIAAGDTSHALDNLGQAWSWGSASYGTLGDNTTTGKSSPIAVCMGGRTFCQISVGEYFVLALDNLGQAWAWGVNTYGQLGDSTTTAKSSPVAVCMGGRTFCQISVGRQFSVALDLNGRAWAWGYNLNYNLGRKETTSYSSPVAVCNYLDYDRVYVQISAGYNHSLALDQIGQVWVWGDDSTSQLGRYTSNTNAQMALPICMGGRTFCQISAKYNSSYVIDNLGQAFAWGYNLHGELGDNTTTGKSSPVAVCFSTNVTTKTFCRIVPVNKFNFGTAYNTDGYMGISTDNKYYIWGANLDGAWGTSPIAPYLVPTPTKICSLNCSINSVAPGWGFNALTDDGKILQWSWGTQINTYTPTIIDTANRTYCQIAAGGCNGTTVMTGVALTHNGLAYSWGYAANGALGNFQTATNYFSPVAVCQMGRTFCQIFAAPLTTYALDNLGGAWVWGVGTSGILGDTTAVAKSSPVAVCLAGRTFCQIQGAATFAVGLSNLGQAFAWGAAASGILGDNTTTGKSSPVAVCMGGRTFCQISVGILHTIALDNLGQAFAWGQGTSGELGDNSVTANSSPVAVCMGGRTFCQITTGQAYSLALDQNGQLFVWGNNLFSNLGTGNLTNYSSPVAVCVNSQCFTKIFANKYLTTTTYNSFAICTNNNIWCWGANNNATFNFGGQNVYSNTPVEYSFPTICCNI